MSNDEAVKVSHLKTQKVHISILYFVFQLLDATIEEMKKFSNIAAQNRTKNLLNAEITKIENEIQALKMKAANDEEKKSAPRARSITVDLTEHAYDESDRFVKIFIPFNYTKITDENVLLDLTENSFTLIVKGESKDYRFKVINLLRAINVEKSYKKVKPDMISIYLKKVKEGEKWGCLTATEKKLKDQKSTSFDQDKDSSSSDPMGGIMDMMKKLYDSGDSEMKRTIAKAWTEGQEKKNQTGPMF